jgi:transcription elongation factor Elf1
MMKVIVMGRRRKKVVHIPKKHLPKFFSCPRCGKETVRVEIFREDGGRSVAQCSSCGLKEEFQIKPAQGEVDVYCMLTDRIYSSIKRTPVAKSKTE